MFRSPNESAETSEHNQIVFRPANLNPERDRLLKYSPQAGPSFWSLHGRKAGIDKPNEVFSSAPNESNAADLQNLPVLGFSLIHGSAGIFLLG
jgi:hypothetical protein